MMAENDPKLIEHAIKIANECGTVVGERCKQALKFAKCAKEIFVRDNVEALIV